MNNKSIKLQNPKKPSSNFLLETTPYLVIISLYFLGFISYSAGEYMVVTETPDTIQPQPTVVEHNGVNGDSSFFCWKNALKIAGVAAVAFVAGILVYHIGNQGGFDFPGAFQDTYDGQADIINAINESNKSNRMALVRLYESLVALSLENPANSVDSQNIPTAGFSATQRPFE